MDHATKTLSTATYGQLLERCYATITIRADRKTVRVRHGLYLVGILTCYLLAIRLPAYRDMMGAAILLLAVFLLSSSARFNIKKRQQKKIRQLFDRMLFQVTEVRDFVFDYNEGILTITLQKNDGSSRAISYPLDKVTAFQWLGGGFLLSNAEGIDFIIPDGIFSTPVFEAIRDQAEGAVAT